MMNGLILVSKAEASSIYGGKDQAIAHFVEFVAQCFGLLTKLLYRSGQEFKFTLARQLENGYYPK